MKPGRRLEMHPSKAGLLLVRPKTVLASIKDEQLGRERTAVRVASAWVLSRTCRTSEEPARPPAPPPPLLSSCLSVLHPCAGFRSAVADTRQSAPPPCLACEGKGFGSFGVVFTRVPEDFSGCCISHNPEGSPASRPHPRALHG